MATTTISHSGTPTMIHSRSVPPSGAERLYIVARWIMLLLMFGIGQVLGILGAVETVSPDYPAKILLLGYVVYALLTTVILFIPPLRSVLRWSYALDILFIMLLMLLSSTHYAIFYPLCFLPLLYAATNQLPISSLLSGFVAALLYAAVFAYTQIIQSEQTLEMADYVTFALQSVVLLALPWIASNLTQHEVDTSASDEALHKLQTYREQMQTFFSVAETLSSVVSTTTDFRTALQSALHRIEDLMPYCTGLILIASGRPKELSVLVVDPMHPGDQGKSLDISESSLATLLNTSASAYQLDTIQQDTALQSVSTLQACQSACMVPLRSGVRTYGVLVVASKQSGVYTHEHLEMLQALANYIMGALQMTQMSGQLKAAQNSLRSREQDVRVRLARHLHDGPTQKIAAFAMQTDFIKQCFANHDVQRALSELKTLGDLARKINQEMRLTLAELRPIKLENEGLIPALRDYVERVRSRANEMEVSLDTKDATGLLLPKETEAILFDIIQESLNNAIKYAQAQHVQVCISREDDTCAVSIKDDGKGFDVAEQVEAAAKRGSYGLRNFQERVDMLGGSSTIDSAPGKGTLVKVVVPLETA